ncbi:GNAT family N-acetyltransferase [Kitasatospora sp. NA04385]|uniref:GNAT family N-acetyltransferase n=1 Tax=Kitasatospora sp. NA04385 TaxID=2742135 RepID=UPI001592A245|nr:GNAT family N-acetyltransferase [Kitasatospora sp. NA04385]QKW23507.1 GNAT family N-acetyltransferase [Kitasatospora sp. NA04385]
MIFRPIVPQELNAVLAQVRPDPSTAVSADTVRARLADGEYRHRWIWVAEPCPGRAPLAVAIWWGSPADAHPSNLDALFARSDPMWAFADLRRRTSSAPRPTTDPRSAVAAALLVAAHRVFAVDGLVPAPDYHLLLPSGWRDRPETAASVAWRRRAAEGAGLRLTAEQLRFERAADRPVPSLSNRLSFTPEPDDEIFVDLFRRCLSKSLDTTSTRKALRIGAEEHARDEIAFYRHGTRGRRSWWRIARTTAGQVVGFAIPSHNSVVPVVGYLGVLPEFRGRGFAAEILAEATRVLAAETRGGVIRAETNLSNHPVVAALELVGYRDRTRRLVFSAT